MTIFRVCSCNDSMPLDAAAADKLGQVLDGGTARASNDLCRKSITALKADLQNGEPVVVGCTQESHVFASLSNEAPPTVPLKFVNLREMANTSTRQAVASALPKMAALLADAALPEPDPVATVQYASEGRVLIIGSAARALSWANRLRDRLQVEVLLLDSETASNMPQEMPFPVYSGQDIRIDGWLGAFSVTWQQRNPIDLAVCVRCNACLNVCPEQAIDFSYQIDANKCHSHGDCVQACNGIGAIDFHRGATQREGHFDLVFDLSVTPLLSMHQPPQGYFHAGQNANDEFDAALQLTAMVGEFEKPKFFHYKEKLCAHSRNKQIGCHACIDVCSAEAIQSSGNLIKVNPHLCVGCGACTTVCPSGALSYAYPTAPYSGGRLQAMLNAYRQAEGQHPVLLLHSEEKGAALIKQLSSLAGASKSYQGVPSHVIPFEIHHTASAGIDLWLSAIAYGAQGIAVLVTDEEALQYVTALKEQMLIAQSILPALGYAGEHLRLIKAAEACELDQALQQAPFGEVPRMPATFQVFADKRNTLEFALDHLYLHAPVKTEVINLPEGSSYGAIKVNTSACTLCMACTGVCPSSALMDTPDRPQLRFIEKNCVQCGLCANTCPEEAITLLPQLSFKESAKKAVTLNEEEPFCCIRCKKPFSTMRMMENILAKLEHHAAFSGNLDRIKMCGDCRVVDMMEHKHEAMVATPLRR